MPDDRRQECRILLKETALGSAKVLISQREERCHAELVDLSLNGFLAQTPKEYRLRSDMPCLAELHLKGGQRILMHATLIHSGHCTLGFHCTNIDKESLNHLRQFIASHLNQNDHDIQLSQRVLSEMMADMRCD